MCSMYQGKICKKIHDVIINVSMPPYTRTCTHRALSGFIFHWPFFPLLHMVTCSALKPSQLRKSFRKTPPTLQTSLRFSYTCFLYIINYLYINNYGKVCVMSKLFTLLCVIGYTVLCHRLHHSTSVPKAEHMDWCHSDSREKRDGNRKREDLTSNSSFALKKYTAFVKLMCISQSPSLY